MGAVMLGRKHYAKIDPSGINSIQPAIRLVMVSMMGPGRASALIHSIPHHPAWLVSGPTPCHWRHTMLLLGSSAGELSECVCVSMRSVHVGILTTNVKLAQDVGAIKHVLILMKLPLHCIAQ